MKCVVLGGAGFIGSHLAGRLLAAGHAVRVFDLHDPGPAGGFPRRSDVEWVSGDFLDPQAVRRAISGCDAAFHLV